MTNTEKLADVKVALRTEGVDRNVRYRDGAVRKAGVALRTEGVDRNTSSSKRPCQLVFVALRTEGVDRNSVDGNTITVELASPSVRRAWIEMDSTFDRLFDLLVALRTEGVDRNCWSVMTLWKSATSPSVRRAWIEISFTSAQRLAFWRSPSVRRAWIEILCCRSSTGKVQGRPPYGGRG